MKWLLRGARVAVVAALAGCGGMAVTGDGGTGDAGGDAALDAAASKDATADADAGTPTPLDAGAFCTGPTPRIQINGTEQTVVSATGKGIILNCCDSAELIVATSAYQALLDVLWRAPATGTATLDLANPPQGFSIEMDLGCDPATTSCAAASPEERYADGFSGTLSYAMSGTGPTTSYCIQVAESPSQPHALIHSMLLYAPNVAAP